MESHEGEAQTGLGADDLEKDTGRPDFNRGAGGEPIIQMPDGKSVRYARMSSIGDKLDDKTGLNNWLVSKAMEGLGRDEALIAKVKAVTPYEDHRSEWTRLREDAISAGRGRAKADIGTAVHLMSERFEQEPEFDPGAPYTMPLQAYVDGLNLLGLKSQMFEVQFVNDSDEVHAAGTADRVYETTKPLITPDDTVIPAGSLIIGDIKTSKEINGYNGGTYSIQLAGYAGGTLYDVELNERMPTPTIRQDWGIIIHISVEEATAEFIWVDLEVGRFGARLANEVAEWRRAWRRKQGYSATLLPVKLAEGVPAPEAPAESEAAPAAPERPLPDDLDAWREHHRIRLNAIRENADAKAWMLVRWPEDLLPPKKLTTLEESAALDAFLARVEAEFGMTFAEGRPVDPDRVKGSKAVA